MTTPSLVQSLPLPALYTLSVALILLAITAGSAFGKRVRSRRKGDQGSPIGSLVGAMLGLLAFILTFTFGITTNRFDARKHLLLDEVNAIGTAYLRTDFLPDANRTDARALLREYVDLRIDIARHDSTHEQLAAGIARSTAIQSELWQPLPGIALTSAVPMQVALYTDALNSMFDLQNSRIVHAFEYRIPTPIWLTLAAITTLAMGSVGYQIGLANSTARTISIVLALTFSAVVLLIADVDQQEAGAMRVSQAPMLALQAQLRATP